MKLFIFQLHVSSSRWNFSFFFISIREMNRLVSKGMSNIYYWEKLTFSKLRCLRKENLKKRTCFEEKKGTRYIRENVYFGIVVLSCLSSTKACLRFILICFARDIKDFFQSSLENEVDFRDKMNVSLNILAKIKTKKNWHTVL